MIYSPTDLGSQGVKYPVPSQNPSCLSQNLDWNSNPSEITPRIRVFYDKHRWVTLDSLRYNTDVFPLRTAVGSSEY